MNLLDTSKLANEIAVILNNHLEIETLENLRDTLLPKLMSGEIRVKDAERAVEAVV